MRPFETQHTKTFIMPPDRYSINRHCTNDLSTKLSRLVLKPCAVELFASSVSVILTFNLLRLQRDCFLRFPIDKNMILNYSSISIEFCRKTKLVFFLCSIYIYNIIKLA